jgi:uncharacterized protein YbjT (DUF2867 family)
MIVITAPTGKIGHQVLDTVIASDEQVRVIVREPLHLSAHIRGRVEVVQGSLDDSQVVNKAFAGADTVFWLLPPDPKATSVKAAYVDFTRPASVAIKNRGVKRVVGITALGRGSPVAGHAGLVTASLAMDDLIASTGVAFRALTMPSFMDNLLMQLESIRDNGVFFSPIDGELKLPTCATRDIAALAAKLLLDPSWSGQEHVAVLGPKDLSLNEMAQVMSEVLGKPIRLQQISLVEYKAGFIERGMSESMAQGMTDMADAKNQGLDNAESRSIENTTQTGFRQWCEEALKPAVLH